jgi:hypothetical protein
VACLSETIDKPGFRVMYSGIDIVEFPLFLHRYLYNLKIRITKF